MDKLIIFVGPPLSGKTTLRNKMMEESRRKREPMVYVNRDEERWKRFGRMYKHSNWAELEINKILKEKYKYYNELGADVIIDNTNLKQKFINDIIKFFPDYKVEYVYFNVPLWKLHLRNVKRLITQGRWIPIKVINRMFKEYQNIKIYD